MMNVTIHVPEEIYLGDIIGTVVKSDAVRTRCLQGYGEAARLISHWAFLCVTYFPFLFGVGLFCSNRLYASGTLAESCLVCTTITLAHTNTRIAYIL